MSVDDIKAWLDNEAGNQSAAGKTGNLRAALRLAVETLDLWSCRNTLDSIRKTLGIGDKT